MIATIIITIIWLLFGAFNLYKIYQSSQGADLFESLFAAISGPLYTLMALVVIFIIKPWN
jgi:type IV secretory pathway VirB2 component (pilin)